MNLIEKYKELHAKKKYGVTSPQYKEEVQSIIDKWNIESVLDFGCGQSSLLDELEVKEKYKYDPAIPEYDTLPDEGVDMVICTDVLEHIPKEEISLTLSVIASYCHRAYFQIALFKHGGKFEDGTDLHCTVESREWWEDELRNHFRVIKHLPVYRKPMAKKEWAGFLVSRE